MDSKLASRVSLKIWRYLRFLIVFLNERLSVQKLHLSSEKELLWKLLGNQVILFQQFSPGKIKVVPSELFWIWNI